MRVLGVDPGTTGAIVLLDTDIGAIRAFDTPSGKAGPKGRSVIVDGIFARHVKALLPIDVAVIEDVHSMPTDGSASAFKFGTAFGIIRGIVAANEVRVVFVSPAKWKARLGLTGKEKDAARLKAIELFPRQANLFARKKDHARADAVLLAYAHAEGLLK